KRSAAAGASRRWPKVFSAPAIPKTSPPSPKSRQSAFLRRPDRMDPPLAGSLSTAGLHVKLAEQLLSTGSHHGPGDPVGVRLVEPGFHQSAQLGDPALPLLLAAHTLPVGHRGRCFRRCPATPRADRGGFL